jgi:hypothetical protein
MASSRFASGAVIAYYFTSNCCARNATHERARLARGRRTSSPYFATFEHNSLAMLPDLEGKDERGGPTPAAQWHLRRCRQVNHLGRPTIKISEPRAEIRSCVIAPERSCPAHNTNGARFAGLITLNIWHRIDQEPLIFYIKTISHLINIPEYKVRWYAFRKLTEQRSSSTSGQQRREAMRSRDEEGRSGLT